MLVGMKRLQWFRIFMFDLSLAPHVLFPRKVYQWKRKGDVNNENPLKIFVVIRCCCFAKIPLYLPFFFPYLKFSKDFPFVENIVLTKIRPPQRALKHVKINKINGIELSRCFGFQSFRKLFSGMGCNIKISSRNFCFLLVNGKRCRQVLYIER